MTLPIKEPKEKHTNTPVFVNTDNRICGPSKAISKAEVT